ncbi:hypothetical protein [Pyrodictium delaneyi]|uniref:hypothetical protein n=1 Tax=Pyrodictium delaneyi TaxID=1273541 RepID=UPI0006DCDD07|nr:hypothetical protein [Pyrodictium delaneyi]
MGDAYGWVAAAGMWTSVFLFVAAAIKFMANNPEEAKRLLVAGLVALFIAAAGPATLKWLTKDLKVQAATASLVVAVPPPSRVAEEFPVEAWFVHTWLTNTSVCVGVRWGDGSESTATLAPGGSLKLVHNYALGTAMERSFNVEMYAWTGDCGSIPAGARLLASMTLTVEKLGYRVANLFIEAGDALERQDAGGFIANSIKEVLARLLKVMGPVFGGAVEATAKVMEVSGFSPGEAFYWLLALPTPDMPGMEQLWARASVWMPLLWPLAAIAGALWRVWRDPKGLDLYEYASDMVLSLIVAVAGLALYAPLAKLYNALALSIANISQANVAYSFLLGHVLLGVALGWNAGAAAVAWTALIAIIAVVVIGVLKWLAAGAIIGLAPVWAAAWLFPPLRGMARSAALLLEKIAVLGLVAAGMLFLASQGLLYAGREIVNIAVAYALPIAITLGGHIILNQLGLGGLPGLGALRAIRAARAAPAAAAGAAAGAATGAIAAAPVAATTLPAAGAAAAPAAAAYRHTEAARQLATTQGMALQLRKKWLQPKPITPAPARAAETVEEARPAIEEHRLRHPRAAAVAAKAAEIGVKAASLLENRARGFAREFIGIAEKELGIRIPERFKPRVLDKYDIETRAYRAARIGEKAGEITAEVGIRTGRFVKSKSVELARSARERMKALSRHLTSTRLGRKMWASRGGHVPST